MMGIVHAGIGAAVGSLSKCKTSAFLNGIASHIVADLIPHTDYPPVVEVPLLAAALAGIAAWKGVDSPEFWGAVGGVAPDVEHGLHELGMITADQEVFPTHGDETAAHGPETGERWSQALLAIVAVIVIAVNARDSR